MQSHRINVGVDIDDTLADFIGPLNDHFNSVHNTSFKVSDYTTTDFSEVWSMEHKKAQSFIEEFVVRMISSDTDPIDLEPIPGAVEGMKTLKESGLFTFYAITARDARLLNYTTAWLNKYFEGIFSGVELCNTYGPEHYGRRTKTEVCKSLSISTLIDDRPDNHTATDSKLRLITFSQPWNTRTGRYPVNWKEVVEELSPHSLIHYVRCDPPQVLIGVSGKLGAGKDTICDIVLKHFSAFERRAFATRVKQTVATLTNTSYEFGCTREGKRFKPKCFDHTLSVLHQKIGTSIKQALGDDVWVRIVTEDPPPHCIVFDTRFKIEADALPIVVRVNGDPAGIRERNEDERDLNHISETDLDDYPFEYIIENDGTMDDLERKVLGMFTCIFYNLMTH
jgi:uncharacterized HAD superfamily protein